MSTHPRRRRLNIETLEDRRVPATWGVAWADPQHITASFVPDGTQARGQSSVLYQTLDAQLGAGNWETTILKALQTWTVNSNINIGLVADGGEPLGVAGPAQGDARFGDIRISAEPLPADVVAITSPYNPAYGSTSGDLILNSNDDFNPSDHGSYDLFTVALHEAGHVFGFADSSDPSSFMYNVYEGPQTGLASGAIPALQSLYGGARNINAIDGNQISTNPSKPVSIASPSGTNTSLSVTGDLASSQDVDYFSFKAPNFLSDPLGIDVQVQTSGLSLLSPKVTVYDPFGNVLATSAATSLLSGGTSVHLAALLPGQNYAISIQGATGDVFSVGSYDLTVGDTLSLGGQSDPRIGSQSIQQSTNSSGTAFQASGTIAQTDQFNTYSFNTPSTLLSGLTVNLQDWGVGLRLPSVMVFNSLGVTVGSSTAPSVASPVVTISVPTILPNSTYYVRVENGKSNLEAAGTFLVTMSLGVSSTKGVSSNNFTLATPWFGSNTGGNGQTNTTLSTASELQTPAGEAQQSRYLAIEGINSTQTQQFYKLTTPDVPSGQTEVMTVSVQTLGTSGLLPWIGVFDQNGNVVNAQVLGEQDGVAVIQVPVSKPGSQYYLEVSSAQVGGTQASGNFYLDATFGNTIAEIGPITSGTLPAAPAGSSTAPVATTLSINQGQLFTFVLTGSASNTGTDAILKMTLVDSTGNVVSTLSTPATLAESMVVCLPVGSYTILISATSPSGRPIPTLAYSLTGTNLTDPIKVYPPTGSGGATTAK